MARTCQITMLTGPPVRASSTSNSGYVDAMSAPQVEQIADPHPLLHEPRARALNQHYHFPRRLHLALTQTEQMLPGDQRHPSDMRRSQIVSAEERLQPCFSAFVDYDSQSTVW
jgi:hypothetical protein